MPADKPDMKKDILLIFFVSIYSFVSSQESVNIMLVTGGQTYDTVSFFEMFDWMDGIEYQHFEQPVANQTIANGLTEHFDVLVFYDNWQEISTAEKNAYISLTKTGKSFLFLHHSLISYQKWDTFEKITGGRYIVENSKDKEQEISESEPDVWVYVQPEGIHPSTRGLTNIRFFDEVYGNIRVSENIVPVLSTRYPKSTEIIGWENHYNSSKIMYIQPGHDYRTFEKEEYRKLLKQTIYYLAGRN